MFTNLKNLTTKLFASAVVAVTALPCFAAPTEPEYSTDAKSTYYCVEFARNNNLIASQGDGKNAVLAKPNSMAYDRQVWKVVGSKSNFQLINAAGEYAVITGTGNAARVAASTTPFAPGFSLVASSNASYPDTWEIQVNGVSGNNRFNQWEGPNTGNPIGLWSANDVNNPLKFVDPATLDFQKIVAEYAVTGSADYRPDNLFTLWYTQPGTTVNQEQKWMYYGLPVGDGQFGAQTLGGVAQEEISFNEKTLWTGTKTVGQNAYGSYQPLGDLLITDLSEGTPTVTDYWRNLDLTTAVATVSYNQNGANITRRLIASNPAHVVALLIESDKAGALNYEFEYNATTPVSTPITTYADGVATIAGKFETVSYNSQAKVIPNGGTMTTGDKSITVKGANSILVLVAACSDYDPVSPTYTSGTAAIPALNAGRIAAALQKGWDNLLAEHIADHQALFGRLDFNLAGALNDLPTDKLQQAYKNGTSVARQKGLEQLYFQYGRYLTIGSSRGVDLPSNLQGIWSSYNKNHPQNSGQLMPWNCDIHSNINVEMNYWPSEPTNLSELHLPYLNYIINQATVQPQWRERAKLSGNKKGWTLLTENNIFGSGSNWSSNYVIANAWYCSHLWQHYLFTQDKEFLKRAIPTMWTCCEFWLERLKKDKDGLYVAPNEWSPEHGPSEDGCPHAQQLVVELFSNTRDAATVLGSDCGISDADLALLNERLDNLDRGLRTETYTGSWGASVNGIKTGDTILREWKNYTYTSGQNGHRHMSHLMCLYPFSQLEPGSDLHKAAINSLQLRGDAATGWSMGWKINLWARALDGNHARTIMKNALSNNVYPNLYDSHAPFQIDGNFAFTSGVAELLLQSHNNGLDLLPALPTAWIEGQIHGLRAIGNFGVDLDWASKKLTTAVITSGSGLPVTVRYPGIYDRLVTDADGNAVTVTTQGTDAITFPTVKGGVYTIDMSKTSGIDAVGAPNDTVTVTVDRGVITAASDDVQSLTVIDMLGRTVAAADGNQVATNLTPGTAVMVTVTRNGNRTETHKAIVR